MKINHNIAALNAYRNLAVNNTTVSKSLEKLSSGLRINRASDDAAGLAISEKMRSQIRGLDMAERNALDGVSFVQTAEGALSSTHSMLQRMRELAVQAANDSNTAVDRDAIQQEINQLTNEVNRISNATEFNTKKLLDGSLSNEATPITIGDAGQGAVFTGGAADLKTSLSAISGSTTVVLTVNGTEYKISKNDLVNLSGTQSTAAVKALVEGATTSATPSVRLSEVAEVTIDANNKITIKSKLPGKTTEVTFNVNANTAVDRAKVQKAFGLPDLEAVGTGTPATRATITGGNAATLTANLSTINSGTSVTVTVDGKVYTIDDTNLKTLTGTQSGATVTNLIGAAKNSSGVTLSTNAAVTITDGKITITSNGSGSTSNVTFGITAGVVADTAKIEAAFGITKDTAGIGIAANTATVTSLIPIATTDLGIISEDAKLTITIDNQNYNLEKTALTNATGTGKASQDLVDAINKALNPGNTANPPGTAVLKDDKIQITSATTGPNSTVSISITGELTTGISTAFGLSALTPGEDRVAGKYQFQFSNKDIIIDGETLPYFNATNPTGWKDAASLKAAIDANDTLSAKYDVGVVNGEIQLIQKDGKESTVAPKITNGKLVALQIGANQGQTVSLELKNMQSAAIGISRTDEGGEKEITLSNGDKLTVWYTNTKQSNNGIDNELTDFTVDVSTHEKAAAAVTVFNDAIERVSAERSRMGSVQNRLEHTVDNLKYMSENTTSAEARIRDLDMALEMSMYTKNNILVQSAQAMLAQANQMPQGVLQLLK